MGAFIDLTGQRFGRLTVQHRSPAKGQARWLCQCDCGTEKVVPSDRLRLGETRSCGCLHREVTKQNLTTHGLSKTPTYQIWAGMKKRCYKKTYKDYKDYGGRGISVCAEWIDSFENFLRDMGERPAGMSIERKDTNGNYEPGNCIWADAVTQNRNRRSTRHVEVNGRRMCLTEACNLYGRTVRLVHRRLTFGWDLMEALTTPPLERWSSAPRDPNDGRATSRRTRSLSASSGSDG